jgi:ketosteroid isomerase-like protein
MPTDRTSQIEAFFADFEHAAAEEDWARYGDMFLTDFLNMDPAAAAPLARDDLIAFLPLRKSVFERAGAIGTRLASIQVRTLDATHALVSTTWDVLFDHDRPPVTLDTTFLLRHEDRWRIAVYLNHRSLPELLASPTH